jgi:hypothetical protein
VRTADLLKECSEEEARRLAAQDMKVSENAVETVWASQYFYVFTSRNKNECPIRILDKKGFIRVQRKDGAMKIVKAKDYREAVSELWKSQAVLFTDNLIRPDYYICLGSRTPDFSGNSDLEKTLMLMELEFSLTDPEEKILIAAAKNKF